MKFLPGDIVAYSNEEDPDKSAHFDENSFPVTQEEFVVTTIAPRDKGIIMSLTLSGEAKVLFENSKIAFIPEKDLVG